MVRDTIHGGLVVNSWWVGAAGGSVSGLVKLSVTVIPRDSPHQNKYRKRTQRENRGVWFLRSLDILVPGHFGLGTELVCRILASG